MSNNFNLKRLLALILTTISIAQASESFDKPTFLKTNFAKLGRSNVAHSYNRLVTPLYRLGAYKSEPAPDALQAMWIEAQNNCGISKENHIPIRITENEILGFGTYAEARPEAVYFQKDGFKYDSYSEIRRTLHHEATHVKYHDKPLSDFVLTGSTIGALAATIATPYALGHIKTKMNGKPVNDKDGNYFTLASIGVTVLSCLVIGFGMNKLGKYMERRADIEGSYATGCSGCVKDATQYSPVEANSKGYLCKSEMNVIVDNLQKDNKICSEHAERHITDMFIN